MKYIEAKNKISFPRRETLLGFGFILAAAISFIFPQAAYGETFWLSFFLFAVFPALIIVFLLKEPLRDFGFSPGKAKRGLAFSIPAVLAFVFANYWILFHTKYGGELSIPRWILGGFSAFLAFEFFISLPLHFFWEFFFRGFFQLGFEKKMGIFSLFLAAIFQTLLFARGNWLLGSLVLFSSLAAGLIVRQSRSIFFSTASLWLISMSLDIMIIRVANQVAR